jgi:adenine/guanine phosphoribosyltransferase-like PRPP-binding protein
MDWRPLYLRLRKRLLFRQRSLFREYFVPIVPTTIQFDTIVTPEFPAAILAGTMAAALGATIALYRRKSDYDFK